MGRIYVDAVRKPFANMNFEHPLQCNKVVRSRQVAGKRALARLIQYENFRLAGVVIVNGLPRFLVRLDRCASGSTVHGMVSELLRCGRLAL